MSRNKDACEIALDSIAKLCGCPKWDYAGQVVRDVKMLVEALKTARSILRHDDLGQAIFLAERISDEQFEFSEEFSTLVEDFNKMTAKLLSAWKADAE